MSQNIRYKLQYNFYLHFQFCLCSMLQLAVNTSTAFFLLTRSSRHLLVFGGTKYMLIALSVEFVSLLYYITYFLTNILIPDIIRGFNLLCNYLKFDKVQNALLPTLLYKVLFYYIIQMNPFRSYSWPSWLVSGRNNKEIFHRKVILFEWVFLPHIHSYSLLQIM